MQKSGENYNGRPISIGSYAARNLSLKQLEAWSEVGALHYDELKRIVKEIVRSLSNNSSPAKTLNAAMKKLEGLFSRREVRGEVRLLNNRHIDFRLAFPKANKEGLIFFLLYGAINARTGAATFDLTSPIQMSVHALQRLYERMGDKSDSAILDEIYSCMGQAIHWHRGAAEIQAKCWPLISRGGFFIGTPKDESLTTTVVTWIRGEQLGKKWGVPLVNLERLKSHKPDRLENSEFAREFLRSFPWMLHEHVPGEDSISLAWEQRDSQEIGASYFDSDSANKTEGDGIEIKQLPKASVSYIAGLNYRDDPPPFKNHTLHTGLVVQCRSDGGLIVGLKNGWVGQVPFRSITRGLKLISGYVPPEVGDDIDVFVRKITLFQNEKAYALSLDPRDVSDANWAEDERAHPIGSVHAVVLIARYNQEYLTQIEGGIRGIIPASEVMIYMRQPIFHGCSIIGQKIEAIVTGYRADKKCLLLSIKNIDDILPLRPLLELYPIGSITRGRCIRNESSYSHIELSPGVYGLLHNLNNWGRELPGVGTCVPVVVFGSDDSILLLAGEIPSPLDRVFYARPYSSDNWNYFKSRYPVGSEVEVQLLFWRESAQAYVVVTGGGIVGTLPGSEVDWHCVEREAQKYLLKPGSIFKVKVLKIHPQKSRVTFSKKALDSHPIDEQITKIAVGSAIDGLITNVLEYGCFVQLRPYGIDALLHRSKIPEGKIFEKGESLVVFIDEIDLKNRRISLSIMKNNQKW
jgi:ribosomal protein S1